MTRGRLEDLDEALAGREKVFKAPPLTPELVAAIKLISPQFELAGDEESRAFWEADQNGACWGEHAALAPLLQALPPPARVLEIGPGLGRSVVFFCRVAGWSRCEFHLYESDGSKTLYTMLGPRSEESFCGNIGMLRHVLAYNDVHNASVFDARALGFRLGKLPGPYDVIYGFYNVGFHWGLEHFLGEILTLMHERSVAFFTVPQGFEPFAELRKTHFRVLRWHPVWPKGVELGMLAISRSPLPE